MDVVAIIFSCVFSAVLVATVFILEDKKDNKEW